MTADRPNHRSSREGAQSRLPWRVGIAVVVWLLAPWNAAADEHQQEFWPEVDIWWRLSPEWRLSLFVAISKNIETAYREGNLIVQGDYAFGEGKRAHRRRLMDEGRAQAMRTFLVRGGYLGGRSLGDRGEEYTERTVFAELHVRTPLKGGVLLQQRLRTDLRWLGEATEFSNRWRYRLQAEKEYPVRARLGRALRERRAVLRLALRHRESRAPDPGDNGGLVATRRAGR